VGMGRRSSRSSTPAPTVDRSRWTLPKRPAGESYASWLASQPAAVRERILSSLTDDQVRVLRYDWSFWARDKQLPPADDDWFIWLLMTGRGFGKTRSGSEWVIERARQGGRDRWIALVGANPADVRKYQIEEGPSSILRVSPPWFTPAYYPAKKLLVWPNGCRATIFSAEKPDSLRGFSGDTAWGDEWAKFAAPQEAFDNLLFGLREAKVSAPKVCITTTPVPLELLVNLTNPAIWKRRVRVIGGSSYENRDNLSPEWFDDVLAKYEGTDLGEQEIHGKLLTEMQGALWRRAWIDEKRVTSGAPPDDLERIVVAVDPPGSSKRKAAECGIVAAGMKHIGSVPHLYPLADLSLHGTPDEWGQAAVDAYHAWKADALVGAVNYGGEMVEHTIRTCEGGQDVAFVYANATRGKAVRAQPVSALYQQGRAHHVGTFGQLELELCTWEPNAQPPMPSPNRLDALVWAAYDLILGPQQETAITIPELRRDRHE